MGKIVLLFTVLMSICFTGFSQNRTVTGSVTDENGKAVPFATVSEKGTKKAISADENGNFSIDVKGGALITVSATGFVTQDVKAGASPVHITLKSSNQVIEEVVVTALGVKRQPKELGYSTVSVSSKDLNQAAVTNVVNGLSAKVSGVSIRLADNSVNPNIKINFRGTRSILGENTALIVVDGMIVDQQYMATLNPDDVDDVNILKGANAAAIYGKDASNGVMIVTTKKGKKGKATVNFKNSTMANTVSYMPKLQYEYSPYGGESAPYVDPLTGFPLAVPFENQSYGPAYNSKDFPLTQIAIGGPDPTGKIVYAPFVGLKNGRKNFFQTGINEQNSLSVSGANSWGSYYGSVENAIIKGIVYNDKSMRNSARFNGTLKLGNFSAAANIGYSTLNVRQAGLSYSGGSQYRPVYWSVINQPAHLNLANFKNVDGDYFSGLNGYINAYYFNPWYQVFHSRSDQDIETFNAALQMDYKFTNWLNLTVRSGYNNTSKYAPSHIDPFAFDSASHSDYWGSGGNAVTNPTLPFQLEYVRANYDDWNNDAFLTFKKELDKFKFTLIAGANYRRRQSDAYWYSNQATSVITLPSSIRKVNNPDGSAYINYNYESYSQAVYGDLTIGYDGWAFLHGSFRNDWNSILFPQTRAFKYGGVDASFILTDKFQNLKSSNGLSFLKIRGGYSITGNVSLPNSINIGALANQSFGINVPTFGAYAIYPTVGVGSGFPYGNLNGYSLSYNAVQPNLRPEKDRSIEAGFEIGFIKDRIRLEANYFNILATDQTLPQSISYATGTSNLLTNTGAIQDNGIELDLKLTPLLKLGDFHWNVGANFTYIDNKVKYITKGDPNGRIVLAGVGSVLYNVVAETGKPVFALYASDWVRDPQGHIIVDANTGMPSTDPNKKYVGSTEPKYFLGLNTSFAYKRVSLSAVVDYRGGNKIVNVLGNPIDFAGISATSAENRSHFVIPNSVIANGSGGYTPNTNTPISTTPYQWWSTVYNSIGMAYMVDASFWKLREINLAYDLPVSAIFGHNQHFIKKFTFALIGQNLLMWRPKSNSWTDPEFSTSINANANAAGSVNEYVTPPVRSFGFSINTTF